MTWDILRVGDNYANAGRMSPFQVNIVRAIRQIQRNTGRPARTSALAVMLRVPETTMRWHLREAERNYVVHRVGQRGGWLELSDDYFAYVVNRLLPFPRGWDYSVAGDIQRPARVRQVRNVPEVVQRPLMPAVLVTAAA